MFTFGPISWWPWIVTVGYVWFVLLFVIWNGNKVSYRTTFLPYGGPFVFLFLGFIEAANKGILTGRGFGGITDYAGKLLIVGGMVSLFSGIVLSPILNGIDKANRPPDKSDTGV